MSMCVGKATKAESVFIKIKKDFLLIKEEHFHPRSHIGVCKAKSLGYWGTQTKKISDRQTAKAVQDQFNFGSGEYTADLKLWKMEQNIDVGNQLLGAMFTSGRYLHNYIYPQAINNKGKTILFDLKKIEENIIKSIDMPFGGNTDSIDVIRNGASLAWVFGRTKAKCTGNITVYDDDSFLIKGELEFKSDTYSWKSDGKKWFHNYLITELGNGCNWKGKDGHGSGKWQLTNKAENGSDILLPLHKSCVHFQSSDSITTGSVLWSKASSSYTSGEMPVNYSRKFYFFILGIIQ